MAKAVLVTGHAIIFYLKEKTDWIGVIKGGLDGAGLREAGLA